MRFPTASTIKTAVMIEAFHQGEAGRLPLESPITLREADKVGGSGVLSGLRDGTVLTVRDLVHLMIVVSDNTATNLLVERLGTARINDRLAAFGLEGTRIFRRADAAIVTAPGLRHVIAICARQVEDTRWSVDKAALVTGARISRMVFDHFTSQAPTSK